MKSGVVVGGGIIGISIARKLAKLGADVILCEKSRHLFMETSSRNSGVIHAGLYYPKDSKMAFHCVRGKLMLYDYLRGRNLPHEQCGKLVVASSENDLCILEALHKKGIANGVLDLRMVSVAEIRSMEPACSSTVGALLSPSTGIVDQHALCESLLVEAEEAGAIIALETDVTRIETTSSSSFIVHSSDKGDIAADFVVNAAGLGATQLAGHTDDLAAELIPTTYYAKGTYFRASFKERPFQRLIYPLPEPGGLGIHATLMLAGDHGVRFGPDVEWLSPHSSSGSSSSSSSSSSSRRDVYAHEGLPDLTRAYQVDETKRKAFFDAVHKYFPTIREEDLSPDYVGIRPKLVGPAGGISELQDFMVQDSSIHGIRGLINLYGIQSPGLTSSLSIAHDVALRVLREG